MTFPVVDLFAGPGGLGEGFASATGRKGAPLFHSAIAIEMEDFAHQTLTLRHFFRNFPPGEAPEDYYDFLEKRIPLQTLYARYPDAYTEAQRSARKLKLGKSTRSEARNLITSRLGKASEWVLVGGPPCQAYSLAGRSRMKHSPTFAIDERHTLYEEYLDAIATHRPPVFVMENVKGLLSATHEGKSMIGKIVEDLSRPHEAITGQPDNLTYKLYSLSEQGVVERTADPRQFVVRAEAYGIPQARHRMFIVGVRSDLDIEPDLLTPSECPTVRDTIGFLPRIRSTLSKTKDSQHNWIQAIEEIATLPIRTQLNGATYANAVASSIVLDNLRKQAFPDAAVATTYPSSQSTHPTVQSLHDERLKVLVSHEARGHMVSDLHRYLFAATFAQETGRSPKLSDFPTSLLPAHQNVEEGRAGKMFSDRFRVQLADHPSTTITSHISKDGHYFIHYDPFQCRSLTVREAARLQTFPDNYFFVGNRTSQYHQVGNAVPPALARQIAFIVADVLRKARKSR